MIETGIIHCGECSEIMSTWPDDCIDLVVTSPPYDSLRDYHGYVFNFEAIAQRLYRVTKPGGVVVWVVADQTINGSETGTSFRQALRFMELGFNLHDTMIYQKPSSQYPQSNRYASIFEFMFVFAKNAPQTVNLIRVPCIPQANGTIRRRKGGYRQADGTFEMAKYQTGKPTRIKGNIWRYIVGGNFANDNYANKHPAIFPEALARDHIISWSNPGDVVLDPMCGSGTVPKMCKELDRQWIGIDISEEYCELSRRRVEGARVPLPEFWGLTTSEE